MRMTACGQTIAHLPHWMQMSGSQTGISSARLRFSYCDVPLGISAVNRHRADGQAVALVRDHLAEHVAHEWRARCWERV